MPHQGDADHFFSFCEGAWILRLAEGREAAGTTRAGVERTGLRRRLEGHGAIREAVLHRRRPNIDDYRRLCKFCYFPEVT